MKHIIGLAGPPGSFLPSLADYVNRQGEAEVFLCTEEDMLRTEVERRKPEVLFAVKGFALSEQVSVPRIDFVPEREVQEGIYQYQAASDLYKEMCRYMGLGRPKRIPSGEKMPVYAVYSPVGRSGKTSFACAYAREHSFFYISMEEYGNTTNDFCSDGRLFYYMRNRRSGLVSEMLTWAENRDGIYVFGAPLIYSDITSLEVEDFQWLIEELRKNESIAGVIIDFGTGCLGNLEILDLFDQVYIPVLEGVMESEKTERFYELLFEMNGKMTGKRKEIIVPDMSWKSPGFLNQVQYVKG